MPMMDEIFIFKSEKCNYPSILYIFRLYGFLYDNLFFLSGMLLVSNLTHLYFKLPCMISVYLFLLLLNFFPRFTFNIPKTSSFCVTYFLKPLTNFFNFNKIAHTHISCLFYLKSICLSNFIILTLFFVV